MTDTDQIVELDPNLCDGPNNNRTDYKYVDGLAQSIASIGQTQPIEVVALDNGRYEIVSGHTRTLACKQLGINVRAVILPDNLTPKERYARTLAENDSRQDTNDIEKATGYRRAIEEHGYTIEELARQIGKRVDYIERRLNLLQLMPEYQHMIAVGQLPIMFGSAMHGLTHEYQYAAMARLVEYERAHGRQAGIEWFRVQCADLLAKQNQLGLFSFGAAIVESEEEIAAAIALPDDPADYNPQYDPLDLEASLVSSVEKWTAAAIAWAGIGDKGKAAQSRAIARQDRAVLDAIRAQRQAAALDNERQEIAGRIAALLEEHGSMTTARLYQYANMAKDSLAPVLAHMVRAGQVIEEKAGRGYRYSLAG